MYMVKRIYGCHEKYKNKYRKREILKIIYIIKKIKNCILQYFIFKLSSNASETGTLTC